MWFIFIRNKDGNWVKFWKRGFTFAKACELAKISFSGSNVEYCVNSEW